MSKKIMSLLIFLFSLTLAACGGGITAIPEPTLVKITSTPDPCSSENLPAEVGKVNKFMREFDDYSSLASNTPQTQLIQIIPDLQRVLRDAEDQTVPACLDKLKKLQLAHMSIVVQTLMGFMGSTDTQKVNAGIVQARELHSQYEIEMARLLGITISPPPTFTPGAVTPETNASPATTSAITAANLGAGSVNLRIAPDLTATEAGALGVGVSTIVLGKTTDDQWLQVQIPDKPGQVAWVYAQLVQLSVPIASVPVITP